LGPFLPRPFKPPRPAPVPRATPLATPGGAGGLSLVRSLYFNRQLGLSLPHVQRKRKRKSLLYVY